jgi:hypothetical protein
VLPVDVEAGAGDCARAERVAVRGGVGGSQPAAVALQLFDHRQQVVRDGGRLRRLGMGVGGEHRCAMPGGQLDQRGAQFQRRLDDGRDELPLPHPVHRHVDVVAAARGVQAAGDVLAARGDQQPFDVEEQILAGAVVRRLPDFRHRDRVERIAQAPGVRLTDDPALGEHHQVRIVDRHQRRQEQRLGVFEILVEDLGDVRRIELHSGSIANARAAPVGTIPPPRETFRRLGPTRAESVPTRPAISQPTR